MLLTQVPCGELTTYLTADSCNAYIWIHLTSPGFDIILVYIYI